MACNGVLIPLAKSPPLQISCLPPPSPPSVLKLFTPTLRLEMAASGFFTHGYVQQAAYVHIFHISEAIITD